MLYITVGRVALIPTETMQKEDNLYPKLMSRWGQPDLQENYICP